MDPLYTSWADGFYMLRPMRRGCCSTLCCCYALYHDLLPV